MGIDLQNAVIIPETRLEAIDKEGNTWLAFIGLNNSRNYITNAGVLMYDGNKFHQFEGLQSLLGENRSPLQVYYSKTLDKLFLTTFQSEPELFDGNNQRIYEFNDGKWEPSNILEKIYPLRNLKTDKVIDDFLFSTAVFLPANRFFPEMLIIPNSGNINQSSTHADQLFYLKNDKWKKFDAFEGNSGYEINDGMVFISPRGLGFYYPNFSRMLTIKDGLLMNQSFIVSGFTDMKGLVWISYSYIHLVIVLEVCVSLLKIRHSQEIL